MCVCLTTFIMTCVTYFGNLHQEAPSDVSLVAVSQLPTVLGYARLASYNSSKSASRLASVQVSLSRFSPSSTIEFLQLTTRWMKIEKVFTPANGSMALALTWSIKSLSPLQFLAWRPGFIDHHTGIILALDIFGQRWIKKPKILDFQDWHMLPCVLFG